MAREALNDSLVNPAKIFYSWSGDGDNGGVFKYYDKDEKKNVLTPVSAEKPFTFIVIGVCSTIKGFSESAKSGIWANEVKDLKSPFTVRTKDGIMAQGLYENIKEKVSANGGKFSQSVYAAMKAADGSLQIVNIQLYGSALGPWIDFCKKTKLHEVAVQVKGVEKGKKGKTEFYTPVFSEMKVSKKTDDEAGVLQAELNQYLASYFAKKIDNNTDAAATPQIPQGAAPKNVPVQEQSATEPVISKPSFDSPFSDDDDIPF